MYGCFVRILKSAKCEKSSYIVDELKSAGATKRRDERADGSVLLKLSGKSTNSLKVLPEVVVSPKMLNEMIEQAHRDFVANEQHKTRVKDGRVPGYQFCSVLNKCIRPLPVRDTKIIH